MPAECIILDYSVDPLYAVPEIKSEIGKFVLLHFMSVLPIFPQSNTMICSVAGTRHRDEVKETWKQHRKHEANSKWKT